MEIKIQSLHFEASRQLESFIQKKVKRLAKFDGDITVAEVTLRVTKPETNANKEVSIRLSAPGPDFFAQEVADTFEEAIDNSIEKLERQIIKAKEKKKGLPGRPSKKAIVAGIE
jgi:putative sigma-54 modulation protein